MATQISTFNFKSNPVRIETIKSEPYFCLTDVCTVLNISNANASRFNFNSDGIHKMYSVDKLERKNELTFINEPNLYRIIFRSNKAEAVEFQNWVFEEVLPQIRKNGQYHVAQPALPSPELTYSQSFSQTDINHLVWLLFTHEKMRFLLENLYKPLALLDSPFAPKVYGYVTEYKRIYKTAKPMIKKLLDHRQRDNPEQWRHLTRYLNNEI
ncbi:antirepressor [Rodentibacter trehalosifermentans]|uniref:Antirepressor n=1 Tax=Rodentibacter trehalosifermentans TaxID=1908263 RepID=A0A1V3J030_9PAST|nr:BRO family protein [Rodentibacter trehalosifermentans]OOF45798.1 antirepressor [Rodentibacter trehalosifermentans]OOF47945.1 antirepressor [Rodentibacter trehalosifermentans]